MALILSIETATEICSVALTRDSELLASRQSAGNNEHSALLTTFIGEVFLQAGIQLNEIDAVAVSMGPGSYTGLRIGVSAAKGLCYSLEKPLIAVSTLQAIAIQALILFPDVIHSDDLLCPMIDARRMEVYSAIYSASLEEKEPVEALILDQDSFKKYRENKIFLFGSGSYKCRELYNDQANIHFLEGIFPSAKAIAEIALQKYLDSEFENTAYFEPFYLKDFIAGKPRVKGLYE